MKVLTVVFLAIGSVTAAGSGPYLPSGWRPEGPAFYLPSEVKSSPAPIKEVIQETEASGSDFLREYGPPKVLEVSQDITQQALPDVVTDQTFAVIDARFNEVNQEVSEEATEGDIATVEETATATESEALLEVKTTVEPVIQGKSINIEIQAEEEEEPVVTLVEEQTTERLGEVVEKLEVVEEKAAGDVNVVKEEVKNIAEALVSLENEIKAELQTTIQEVTEVRTLEDNSGSLQQGPEGFLEYGPPGFKEYGPPKQDEVLRSEAVLELTTEAEALENNETRKRRFSPKFRVSSRRFSKH